MLQSHQSNGYKILYLSARAMGQSQLTRDYIRKVVQGGVHLPRGPVITSPDSIITSLTREVGRSGTQLFKTPCLWTISNAFGSNPFVGGFGNRENDAISYRAAGIPQSHIFIAGNKNELHVSDEVSSYAQVTEECDVLFPPLQLADAT